MSRSDRPPRPSTRAAAEQVRAEQKGLGREMSRREGEARQEAIDGAGRLAETYRGALAEADRLDEPSREAASSTRPAGYRSNREPGSSAWPLTSRVGNLLLGDDLFTQMTDTAVHAPAPHESAIEMLRDDDGVVQVPRLVAVEAREAFRLWVSFADGTQGEVDMSRAPGQAPPGWFEPGFFTTARIRGAGFAVVWGDEEEWDACTEAMWLTLNGYEWDDLVDPVAR